MLSEESCLLRLGVVMTRSNITMKDRRKRKTTRRVGTRATYKHIIIKEELYRKLRTRQLQTKETMIKITSDVIERGLKINALIDKQ